MKYGLGGDMGHMYLDSQQSNEGYYDQMLNGDRYFKILSTEVEPQYKNFEGYNYSPDGFKYHNHHEPENTLSYEEQLKRIIDPSVKRYSLTHYMEGPTDDEDA